MRAFALWILFPMVVGAQEGLSRPEIVKRTKPATALVETKDGVGSGFCVHASGLFITNEHVIDGIGSGETVTLVLDSGLATQKKLKAKVIRRDATADLALLRAEGDLDLPKIELGSDEDLAELTEIIAFGFPFGAALAKSGTSPAVSVNVGSVTSLRLDAQKKLNRIQVDAVLNPGNSGGPVVDRSGKVVGVVISGIRGAGINLLIPVSHVYKFLSRPEITIVAPPISPNAKSVPAEFKANVMSFAPGGMLELEMILGNSGGERRFPMKAVGSGYVAEAAPFPDAGDTSGFGVTVKFPDGSIVGRTDDREVTIGKETMKLGEVRQFRLGSASSLTRGDGKTMNGPLTGMERIPLRLGGNVLDLNLATATELTIAPQSDSNTFSCTVIAKQAGKEIGRQALTVYPEGVERASLESLKEGKFVKPAAIGSPTNYLRMASSKGDYIGAGKTYAVEETLSIKVTGQTVSVSAEGFTLQFAAPRTKTLGVGEYGDAKKFPYHDIAPGMDISATDRKSNKLTGKFVIWEFERKGDRVTKLAIDFVQRCEGTMPPLYGMLRVNSSFE